MGVVRPLRESAAEDASISTGAPTLTASKPQPANCKVCALPLFALFSILLVELCFICADDDEWFATHRPVTNLATKTTALQETGVWSHILKRSGSGREGL